MVLLCSFLTGRTAEAWPVVQLMASLIKSVQPGTHSNSHSMKAQAKYPLKGLHYCLLYNEPGACGWPWLAGAW